MTAKPHVLNLQVEIMFFIIRYLKVTSGLGFPVKIKQVFFFFSPVLHVLTCAQIMPSESTKHQTVALKLEGGLFGVFKALISRPREIWVLFLVSGSVTLENSIYLCLCSPAAKGRGCSFPAALGPLKINLLSETDNEH